MKESELRQIIKEEILNEREVDVGDNLVSPTDDAFVYEIIAYYNKLETLLEDTEIILKQCSKNNVDKWDLNNIRTNVKGLLKRINEFNKFINKKRGWHKFIVLQKSNR